MSDFTQEEQPETIWIEVEVQEDDDGLNCYSGLAVKEQVEKILDGTNTAPFLKLDHVFWIRTDKETEWEKERRKVVEYGKGRYGNQKGSMYFRVDKIILLSELRGGAELQRRFLKD